MGGPGAFAQAGPALALLDDGREDRLRLDARLGLFLAVASEGCAGAAGGGFRLAPCLESYGEATYVSRYDHNVIGFGRARAGVSYLATGPVRWQLLGELRAAVDRNQDYYNNLADVGLAHRWRLVARGAVRPAAGGARRPLPRGVGPRPLARPPRATSTCGWSAATYLSF